MFTSSMRLRTTIIFFSFCSLYIIALFNLFLIQIWNTAFFSALGTHQYQITITQLPPRAPILDRTGKDYLATNKEVLSAFIIPSRIEKNSKTLSFIKRHFPYAYQQLPRKQNRAFMYLKRRLSEKELKTIQHVGPDIHLVREPNRFYPLPCATPLIGFTDIDTKGLAGIELSCNQQLAGKPTTYRLERDARSGCFYFKRDLVSSGTDCKPIQLTIDSDLQFLVDQELEQTMQHYNASEGAILVMDPITGEILACVCRPYANPNSGIISIEQIKPLPITESYEFGSVMKVFTALAALEENVVTPDETIDCKNKEHCSIDGRVINTPIAHGRIPFTDVIAFSNNIGIAQVAKRLNEKLYDHFTKIGFGQKTGVALPGENRGFVNHPSNWSKQSIISLSYGYEVSATLLQLACAFCMIARGGTSVKPKIVMNETKQECSTRLYSEKTIEAIKDILRKTTEYGTGKRFQIKGYDIMSKTGTANLLINGIYDHTKNIFTCASIIEKGDYKRVIVSYLKEARAPNAFAATIVVPLQKKVGEKMVIHERIV